MRKTKIVCTMGPSVDQDDIMRQLILQGMNVARFNFSHGGHEEHRLRIDRLKRLREELDLPIAALLDTKGPEIRTGVFEHGSITLNENDTVIVQAGDMPGTEKLIPVSYATIADDVSEGSSILIDDGLVELEVLRVENGQVICRVRNSGTISNHKGINLPGTSINLPALAERDKEDIIFGIENGFDFVAASFVRKPEDVMEIRRFLDKHGGEALNIIAKIESREGIENFDRILKVADGIMVARGDLGVEIPMQEVPIVQKNLIEKCYKIGKPCITATQMLDSMIRNPRPTRAEVSDVANAIYDGTSAIMLSGETAMGRYPVEAVMIMVDIAEQTEKAIEYWKNFGNTKYEMLPSVSNAISHAACTTAMDLRATAIVAVTHSGRTARLISRFRPDCPIIAPTVSSRAYRQLALSWGVRPYLVREYDNTDAMFEMGMQLVLDSGIAKNGDIIVTTGGTPTGMSGTTNTLKVQIIGRVLVQGKSIGHGSLTAEVMVVNSIDDLRGADQMMDYILVANKTNNDLLPYMKKAVGFVVEDTDPAGHAPTVGLALDIPVIYASENATKILKTGMTATVDFDRGMIT